MAPEWHIQTAKLENYSDEQNIFMNFYIRIFLLFFRIGLFTIGGGYAMIPLIEDELIRKKKWISQEDFVDLMAVAQSSPGIFAVNIAIFIGYKLKGSRGSYACALGAIMPSFLIMLLIALFFHSFKEITIVENIFKGIRPAVVALIAAPTFTVAKSSKINRYNIWIPVLGALLIWVWGFSPIYIIILAGICGYVWGRYKQRIQSKKQ